MCEVAHFTLQVTFVLAKSHLWPALYRTHFSHNCQSQKDTCSICCAACVNCDVVANMGSRTDSVEGRYERTLYQLSNNECHNSLVHAYVFVIFKFP